MHYSEYFGLLASSPVELRNIVADYLYDLGKDVESEAMRSGMCEEDELLLTLGQDDSGFVQGDGVGRPYGAFLWGGSPNNCVCRGTSSGGGWGDGFGEGTEDKFP